MTRRARRQRSRRGYAASDLWNLDAYLCKLIGSALSDLGRSSHLERPDGWDEAAKNLLGWNCEDKLLDQDAYDRAVQGMQWVTHNLGALWD